MQRLKYWSGKFLEKIQQIHKSLFSKLSFEYRAALTMEKCLYFMWVFTGFIAILFSIIANRIHGILNWVYIIGPSVMFSTSITMVVLHFHGDSYRRFYIEKFVSRFDTNLIRFGLLIPLVIGLLLQPSINPLAFALPEFLILGDRLLCLSLGIIFVISCFFISTQWEISMGKRLQILIDHLISWLKLEKKLHKVWKEKTKSEPPNDIRIGISILSQEIANYSKRYLQQVIPTAPELDYQRLLQTLFLEHVICESERVVEKIQIMKKWISEKEPGKLLNEWVEIEKAIRREELFAPQPIETNHKRPLTRAERIAIYSIGLTVALGLITWLISSHVFFAWLSPYTVQIIEFLGSDLIDKWFFFFWYCFFIFQLYVACE